MQAPLLVSIVVALGLAQSERAALAQSVDASELSTEEIESRFGKHRGLVIAPSQGAGPAPEAGTVAEPVLAKIPEEVQVRVNILFDFDSAALRNDQKPKLTTLCQAMHNVDVKLFRIVGHTDASGPAAYNDQLSTLRAEEVKRYLVGDCGISAERLEAIGAGKRQLLDETNPTSERNRRVEFQAMS